VLALLAEYLQGLFVQEANVIGIMLSLERLYSFRDKYSRKLSLRVINVNQTSGYPVGQRL
jgi:hypothetical protein